MPVASRRHFKTIHKHNARAVTSSIRGQLTFNHVRFSYIGLEEVILRDICISIQPQTIVALVGVSGSGKSSILSPLLRLYDVDSGCIKIDDHNIKDLTLESLRSAVGFVPSGRHIITPRSIKQNLLYGKLDTSDQNVYNVCRCACIHEEILSLPKQYESVLGKDLDLSDGQIQRLRIARALVKKPRVLVLDESTNHLDAETEAMTIGSLRKLKCTILMAANRLSIVKSVDQIMVVRYGEIIERGKHDELMKIAGGAYQRLYKQWSKGEDATRNRIWDVCEEVCIGEGERYK